MSTRYNNGSHYENHQRAAELHDVAAHAHRVAEQWKRVTRLGMSIRGRRWSTPSRLIIIRRPPWLLMALFHSVTMTSQIWLINFGKPGVVRTDHRKKIGSMPRKNYEPAPTPIDPRLGFKASPHFREDAGSTKKAFTPVLGKTVPRPALTWRKHAGEISCLWLPDRQILRT